MASIYIHSLSSYVELLIKAHNEQSVKSIHDGCSQPTKGVHPVLCLWLLSYLIWQDIEKNQN